MPPPIATFTMNPAIDISTSVDRVVPAHKLRCGPVRRDAGGGGVNVARVVARLGGAAHAIYPAGGPIGDILTRLVAADGVTSHTIPIAGDTRESFTADEDATGDQYRFVLPGPALTETECEQCLVAIGETEPAPAYFVISGSLPEGVAPAFVALAAEAAGRRGARVAVDTSGPALAAAVREPVFLVKPNLRELRSLVGDVKDGPRGWLEACRTLLAESRVEIVALTLGHRGALLATRDRALYAPVLPVEPVSAVGAGDSFLAGMVWSLAEGGDLDAAFRHGMAAGSAALLSPGTGLCQAEDVRRLLPQIRIESL